MKKPDLTDSQKKAIELLSHSFLCEAFYWTGGTLLSYHYLHHRMSLDIDLFSDTPFSYGQIEQFVNTLKKSGSFTKVSYQKIFDRHEFLFENGETLRIEFVYYNGEKKRLGERQKLLGVSIDSLEDIAANKLMAYFDRNEPKDLFDIYFLITKGGFTPEKLLSLAQKKFGMEFSESLFWSEAFKSFPLLEKLTPFLIEETPKEKDALLRSIEAFFKDGSSQFLQKYAR